MTNVGSHNFFFCFFLFRHIHKMDNENGKFSLYFLAYVDTVPSTEEEKKMMAFSRPGVLELTQ